MAYSAVSVLTIICHGVKRSKGALLSNHMKSEMIAWSPHEELRLPSSTMQFVLGPQNFLAQYAMSKRKSQETPVVPCLISELVGYGLGMRADLRTFPRRVWTAYDVVNHCVVR